MTTERLPDRVGNALFWRATQFGGIKLVFLARLLILAKLLTPDSFGLVAIAVTAVGVLVSITDFGMLSALVQRKELDKDQYDAAWTVEVSRALAISTVVMATAPWIAHLFAEPRATAIIQALAFRPFLESLSSIRMAEMNRALRFRPATIMALAEAVANAVISIVLAPFLGVWALVAGTLSGAAVRTIVSYVLVPHRPRLLFDQRAVLPLVQFGRWVFMTSLIALVASSVLRLVIARQLGVAELGLYFLGAQLAFLPASTASEIVGSVAFPLFARLQTDLRAGAEAFRTILVGMSLFLYPICTLLLVLAPGLVQEVLGAKWDGTVPVIRILAFGTLLGIFGEAVTPLLNGYGQPHKVTFVELAQSLVLIGCVWGFSRAYGLAGAALASLPAVTTAQLVNALLLRRLLPNPWEGMVGLWAIAGASTLGALVAWGAQQAVAGMAGLLLASLLAILTTYMVIWAADQALGLGLLDRIQKVFPGLPLRRLPSFVKTESRP